MSGPDSSSAPHAQDEFLSERLSMIQEQLRKRGITDPRVLNAMLTVPRQQFVPADLRQQAYADKPLEIGYGQTISQPFMVAAMTQALALSGSERILEIGAGSGYQAAILSVLAREVITIESQAELALSAQERLADLGYSNVHVHHADGTEGFVAGAPFDGILVAAAAPEIPGALRDQLREGGMLVIPRGDAKAQRLVQARKQDGKLELRELFACQFVPLLGRYGWTREAWFKQEKAGGTSH